MKFVKIPSLITKNPYNLGACQIIKILLILHTTHIIFKNKDKFRFYVDSHINYNQFNKLYDLEQIENMIRNTNTFALKLELALIQTKNYRLEVARGEK